MSRLSEEDLDLLATRIVAGLSLKAHQQPPSAGGEHTLPLPPASTRRSPLQMNLDQAMQTSEIQEFVAEYTQKLSPALRAISLSLYENPEIGFEESKAHALLTKALDALGFEISGHESLPTAFYARFSHGNSYAGEKLRCVGINAEYDALRGLGHACGHNLIAICAVGSAAILKAVMEKFDIPGSILLLGTPAEELLGGKNILLREGAYDEMDVCLISHPGPAQEAFQGSCVKGGPATLASAQFQVEFFGKSAHAGGQPWMGINALDSAIQGYNAVSLLRQQIKPDHRIHGVLLPPPQSWNTNAIPDYCKVNYTVRAPSIGEARTLLQKVIKCFTASSKATGCSFDLHQSEDYVCAEIRNNPAMSDAYRDIMKDMFGHTVYQDPAGGSTASSDFGTVCYKLPGINCSFGIPCPPGVFNHQLGFPEAAAKPEAHSLALKALQGMAMVGFKYLTDEAFGREVKRTFDEFKKDAGVAT